MKNELDEWLFIINEDLESANLLFKYGHYLASVYHAHQCVEKVLKYLMIKKGIPLLRVHHLVQLADQLATVFPEIVEFKRDLNELNDFLPGLRYPLGDRLEADDARRAFNIANLLKIKLLEGA